MCMYFHKLVCLQDSANSLLLFFSPKVQSTLDGSPLYFGRVRWLADITRSSKLIALISQLITRSSYLTAFLNPGDILF